MSHSMHNYSRRIRLLGRMDNCQGGCSMTRIEEALTEWFGTRCDDYEPTCACCQAWREYDEVSARSLGREPDAWANIHPDGHMVGLSEAEVDGWLNPKPLYFAQSQPEGTITIQRDDLEKIRSAVIREARFDGGVITDTFWLDDDPFGSLTVVDHITLLLDDEGED